MIKHRVVLTSGDPDGIGLEVIEKALKSITIPKSLQLIIFRAKKSDLKTPSKYKSTVVGDLASALKLQNSVVEIASLNPAPFWVEQSAIAALKKEVSAIVTGPLSKNLIISSGLNDIGHTDILKRICKEKSAFMGFFGKNFNVILASGHMPTVKVESSLNEERLLEVLEVANSYKKYLPKNRQRLPLGLLGLNPHAGDQGLLGEFENKVMAGAIEKAKELFPVEGPLIPDVAFQRHNWKKYSFYIALYHDQGLIPFKMAHGFRGAHLTLGLPIHRSSVDHGTAKDIFGKNKANADSMIDAINWGIKLARGN